MQATVHHPNLSHHTQTTTKAVKKTEHKKLSKEEIVTIIGRIASVMSIIMYVSYITQIQSNLTGHPGSPWQPLAAVFNCVMWSLYGFLKPKKDWPIIIANVPGVFLALAAFLTSFIH